MLNMSLVRHSVTQTAQTDQRLIMFITTLEYYHAIVTGCK